MPRSKDTERSAITGRRMPGQDNRSAVARAGTNQTPTGAMLPPSLRNTMAAAPAPAQAPTQAPVQQQPQVPQLSQVAAQRMQAPAPARQEQAPTSMQEWMAAHGVHPHGVQGPDAPDMIGDGTNGGQPGQYGYRQPDGTIKWVTPQDLPNGAGFGAYAPMGSSDFGAQVPSAQAQAAPAAQQGPDHAQVFSDWGQKIDELAPDAQAYDDMLKSMAGQIYGNTAMERSRLADVMGAKNMGRSGMATFGDLALGTAQGQQLAAAQAQTEMAKIQGELATLQQYANLYGTMVADDSAWQRAIAERQDRFNELAAAYSMSKANFPVWMNRYFEQAVAQGADPQQAILAALGQAQSY